MSNIEDDVKILEEFAEICKAGLACYDQTREGKALEHILAEREQMIAEKKKYTIRLTDEQYRKVIENAQMDTSNDTVVAHRFAVMQQQINEKDKQIQELEEECKRLCYISSYTSYYDMQKGLEKKDKQIQLMSEYMEENMDEHQLDEIYAKQYNCNGMERNWTRGKEKEVEDIKQFFEKLAKEKDI